MLIDRKLPLHCLQRYHHQKTHLLQLTSHLPDVVEVYHLPEPRTVSVPRHVHDRVSFAGEKVWLFGHRSQVIVDEISEFLIDWSDGCFFDFDVVADFHLTACGCAGEGRFAYPGIADKDEPFSSHR